MKFSMKFSITVYSLLQFTFLNFALRVQFIYLTKMSAFDRNEMLKEALDEVKEAIDGSLEAFQEFAEGVMKQIDEFVPEDPDLFLDESDFNATETKEVQKMWQEKWFSDTKEYLKEKYRLKLVPINNSENSETPDVTSEISESSSAYWNTALSTVVDETKEEDINNLAEEKKEEDAISVMTSATTETICQICLESIQIHDNMNCTEMLCCDKHIHTSCRHKLSEHHGFGSYNCPNCRSEWAPLKVFLLIKKTLHFFICCFIAGNSSSKLFH